MDWQLGALKPGQLWQLPLLIFSLLLFGYAAYLFIDPKPGPTPDDRIAEARSYLAQDRPDAAIQVLNKLLAGGQLTKKRQGTSHLLVATAIEQYQKARATNLVANHENIVLQTQRALQCDIDIGVDGFRRLAESYEALNKRKDALANYRRALALDVNRQLKLHRKVIELLLDDNQPASASRELDDYLAIKDLTDAERSWALGLQGQLAIDDLRFAEARALLDQAAKLAEGTDKSHQGEIAFRNGYAALKLNQPEEAERQLRLARDLMGTGNPLDADAAYLLGKTILARGDAQHAEPFFRDVINSNPAHRNRVLAQMERGLIRINGGSDDAGLEDMRWVTKAMLAREELKPIGDQVLDGLLQAETKLTEKGNQSGAIEVLDYELQLNPKPPAIFYSRLGNVLEKRAEQVAAAASAESDAAAKLKQQQEASALLTRAGRAFIKYSEALTLASDEDYADNLWRGIDLFDRAGNSLEATGALELFIAERPSDPQTPDALLRLGRAYDSIGQIDLAIKKYQTNLFRYPNSVAASKSAVPLAQAYMRLGAAEYPKAEQVLLAVVQNNDRLTPDSSEYRQAVFELGRLYYLSGAYEKSIVRFEEYAQRYPSDARGVQLAYQMADSYWKSAALIADQIAAMDAGTYVAPKDGPAPDRIDLIMERRERLENAMASYAKLVDLYRDRDPDNDLDRLYLKLAHFYRADCLYELGRFRESIEGFDRAAMLYPDDPSSVSAYMKIFAAYVELGQTDLATRAHARASVMLSRMPREAFSNGAYVISRDDRERFLRFAGESGLLEAR
jgi:tetratricopeptide (TPR) repeat protein